MSTLIAPRKPSSVDDKLIPLINIVFLLLIFFMIAGQISQPQDQTISVPQSNSKKPLAKTAELLELDSNLALKHNGVVISMQQLDRFLQTMQQAQAITLKADKHILAADLDALLNLLRQRGIARITLYSQSTGQ